MQNQKTNQEERQDTNQETYIIFASSYPQEKPLIEKHFEELKLAGLIKDSCFVAEYSQCYQSLEDFLKKANPKDRKSRLVLIADSLLFDDGKKKKISTDELFTVAKLNLAETIKYHSNAARPTKDIYEIDAAVMKHSSIHGSLENFYQRVLVQGKHESL